MAAILVYSSNLDVNASEFKWDCRTNSGKTAHTGVYIYILEYSGTAGNFRLADKFALTR
jgi:hypothetical protein